MRTRLACYRYYVSHVLLQGRNAEAGSVARVSAPDVETLIAGAIRDSGDADRTASDRDLIQMHLGKAIVGPDHIAITLRHSGAGDAANESDAPPTISIPFKPTLPPRKGVARTPAADREMDEAMRSALLSAIAKSREWIAAIMKAPSASFETIAAQQNLAERHVRFLAPLAYLSPRIIEAIAERRAPADLTVTRLVRALPMVWAEQERQLGLA